MPHIWNLLSEVSKAKRVTKVILHVSSVQNETLCSEGQYLKLMPQGSLLKIVML